jgi:hypothetical protein
LKAEIWIFKLLHRRADATADAQALRPTPTRPVATGLQVHTQEARPARLTLKATF